MTSWEFEDLVAAIEWENYHAGVAAKARTGSDGTVTFGG